MVLIREHRRPLLESLIKGDNDTLTKGDLDYLLIEAAPRLRPYHGPTEPPNPGNLPWLVVGSAACVHNDLRSAPPTGPVIAVNMACYELPITPNIGCTLHHEITRDMARNYSGRLFCARGTDYVTDVLPAREDWTKGTSGLYAVQIALHFGAKRIILAGIPIDDGPHFNMDRGLAKGHEAILEMHRKVWRDSAKELRESGVRSMSGWTRGLLGGPDDYMV